MVMFTIETDAGEVECRMGIRAKDGTSEPTPDDIRNSSAAIVRKVTTNPIKVFLSFHMDTDLFDDETAWDDGGGTVTLDAAMIDQARLQPATDYVLYGVLEGGDSTVYKLLDFTTDNHPADIADSSIYNLPPAEHTFTIRNAEPFLFEAIGQNFSGTLKWHLDTGLLATVSNAGTALSPYRREDVYFTVEIDFHNSYNTYLRTSALGKTMIRMGSELPSASGSSIPLVLHHAFISNWPINLIVE